MKAVIGIITGIALLFIGLMPARAADMLSKFQKLTAQHEQAICVLERQIKAELPKMQEMIAHKKLQASSIVAEIQEQERQLQLLQERIAQSEKQRLTNEQQRLSAEMQKLGTKTPTATVDPFKPAEKKGWSLF